MQQDEFMPRISIYMWRENQWYLYDAMLNIIDIYTMYMSITPVLFDETISQNMSQNHIEVYVYEFTFLFYHSNIYKTMLGIMFSNFSFLPLNFAAACSTKSETDASKQ